MSNIGERSCAQAIIYIDSKIMGGGYLSLTNAEIHAINRGITNSFVIIDLRGISSAHGMYVYVPTYIIYVCI